MAQALAHALHGREFDSLTSSAALDTMLPWVNLLPRHPCEWFYSFAGLVEALPTGKLRQFDIGRIASWLTGICPDRSYPATFIGHPMARPCISALRSACHGCGCAPVSRATV